MALSNAERQRKWRKKQRAENYQEYLKKERRRKKGKYIPTHELPLDKQTERRRKGRSDYKKYYIRQKMIAKENTNSDTEACSATTSSGLKVKMQFPRP